MAAANRAEGTPVALAEKELIQPAARELHPQPLRILPAPTLEPESINLAEHRDWMVRRARAKLSNQQEAEDVVQETLFKVWQASDRAEIGNERAYLCRTLDRNIIARYRSAGARDRLIERCMRERGSDAPDSASAIEEQERCLQVRAALEKLAPRQRKALELLAEGMKVAQIAEAMHTSPRAVTVLAIRAKGNLKAELLRSGFVPSLLALLPMDGLRRLRWRLNQMVHQLESVDISVWQATVSALTVIALAAAGSLPDSTSADGIEATRIQEVTRPPIEYSSHLSPPTALNHMTSQPPLPRPSRAKTVQSDVGAYYLDPPRNERHGPARSPLDQLQELISNPARLLPQCGGEFNCPG